MRQREEKVLRRNTNRLPAQLCLSTTIRRIDCQLKYHLSIQYQVAQNQGQNHLPRSIPFPDNLFSPQNKTHKSHQLSLFILTHRSKHFLLEILPIPERANLSCQSSLSSLVPLLPFLVQVLLVHQHDSSISILSVPLNIDSLLNQLDGHYRVLPKPSLA